MDAKPALKLTAYFNETLRSGGELVADRLLDACDDALVRVSVLTRGIEGFGARHRLHTQRLERASLNQPVVAVAVDAPERITALAQTVDQLVPSGLITTEHAWLANGFDPAAPLPEVAHESVKLTVYCGRNQRAGRLPLVHAIVAHLQSCAVDGATAIPGVDGVVHGDRRRAGFFSRNREVPAMVIALGTAGAIGRALPGVRQLAPDAVITLEGAQICKRNGEVLAAPTPMPQTGGPMWRKLTVHAGGARRYEGEALHVQLIEQLRHGGVAGATALRGSWGYRGAAAAHGNSVWSIRQTSPVVTIAIDRDPGAERAWRSSTG